MDNSALTANLPKISLLQYRCFSQDAGVTIIASQPVLLSGCCTLKFIGFNVVLDDEGLHGD